MPSQPRHLLIALFAAFLCMTMVGGVQAPTGKTLSFEDRVVAQRNIEQVYWSHRIWPETNPGPKPALDQVLTDTLIRERVADDLAKTEALERFWQKPLTGDQLQAELDRMARETKNPEVLRELFAALDDDPFSIAECLARPLLVDRLAREWYARDARFHGAVKEKAEAALAASPGDVTRMKDLGGEYAETEWRLVTDASDALEPNEQRAERPVRELSVEEWREHIRGLASTFGVEAAAPLDKIPAGRVSPLVEHDDRFVVTAVLSTGPDRLRTATVSWSKRTFDEWWEQDARPVVASPAAPDPEPVQPPTSGFVLSLLAPSVCTADDSWTPTSNTGAALYRYDHTAVWTGAEMIVWGGNSAGVYINSGGRYDPATDTWTATSTGANVPTARYRHTAVWTGTEMIVWGGWPTTNTGGRYSPGSDTWTVTSIGTNVPTARYDHTAVWTGTEMIVWGGYPTTNTGGGYAPGSDTWTATSTGTNVPTGRDSHTAVWTGTEMIVWGGYPTTNTGGRYAPASNAWTATSTGTNVPTGRYDHTAVWTGTEMIVWGGNPTTNTGGRYVPGSDAWTATSTGANVPAARYDHTAVWSGSEMIVWGGNPTTNTGGRYAPGSDTWTATSTGANVPVPRYLHTAVWTSTQMIVWGGRDATNGFFTGGLYCPCVMSNWYLDSDGDGFGNSAATILACAQPPGYVSVGGDCNDANPNCTLDCTDADHDGLCVGHDCDDTRPGCTNDCTDADADGYCAPIDCDDGGPPPSIDGVALRLLKGPGGGDVTLNWTGGQPTFDVFRSASPQNVTDPSNWVYSCTERTWSDSPPPGGIHFYKVGSPCVVSCPEICDGVDNDCDGTIDEAGSAVLCGLPNAVAACVTGACVPSPCDANYWDLNANAGDGCEYGPCVYQSPTDQPDVGFVDANCDGMDGDLVLAVFVSPGGNDANPGTTPGLPVKTIARGIAVAVSEARTQVLVEVGSYNANQLTLVNGIGIYGNYQPGFSQRTAVADSTVFTASSTTAVVAANLTTETVLEYMKFASADNPAPSGSSHGLLIANTLNLKVRSCTIVAGHGGDGLNGVSPGGVAANGSPGSRGQAGCEDGDLFCIPTCARPLGGAGGVSSCGATGGAGGNAGHGGYAGGAGTSGSGGALGGPGTPPLNGDWDTPSIYWGQDGVIGTAGANGVHGWITTTATGLDSCSGATGATGQNGWSGGGGGGGGGGTSGCDSYGGGGGGGGAGGCGGAGATGGGSGGNSVAVFHWRSWGSVFTNTHLVTAGGGNGGTGGTGQPSGLGAEGGNCGGGKGNCYGGPSEQQDGSNGGKGGRGGDGAPGGHGGGGNGGRSWGFLQDASSGFPQRVNCTYNLGPGGIGGTSQGNSGHDGSRSEGGMGFSAPACTAMSQGEGGTLVNGSDAPGVWTFETNDDRALDSGMLNERAKKEIKE